MLEVDPATAPGNPAVATEDAADILNNIEVEPARQRLCRASARVADLETESLNASNPLTAMVTLNFEPG